jgi:hypothetical protein
VCACSGKWVVTYPDGRTEEKGNATAARIAAARVPGATYAKVPKA